MSWKIRERLTRALLTSKEGILGGRPNQDYRAIFDPGQQRILLGLVEAVNLVNKEDGAASVLATKFLGSSNRFPDVFHPGQYSINRNEVGAGGVGNNLGQGGFAGSRRAEEKSVTRADRPESLAAEVAPGPTTASCPMNSSRVRGRIRAARGASRSICCWRLWSKRFMLTY